MKKFGKILASLGVVACLGGAITGCADMTDDQLKSALDTAVKGEQTFEELKDIIADQSERLENLEKLLEEKNEILEKYANDKSKDLEAEEAYKLVRAAYMRMHMFDSSVHNVKMSAVDPTGMEITMYMYKTSDGKYLLKQESQVVNNSYFINYLYETETGYDMIGESYVDGVLVAGEKMSMNEDIYQFIQENMFFEHLSLLKESDICQAQRLEDGSYRIVVLQDDVDPSDDQKLTNMTELLISKEGLFISCNINQMSDNHGNFDFYNSQIEISYGELTNEWAEDLVEYIENYEEVSLVP